MKFALHVISGAGFGVPFEWDASSHDVGQNHKYSFRDAISSVLHHLLPIVLVPKALWKLPIKVLQESAEGYYEFGAYMREHLEQEKRSVREGGGQNLLSALVKYSTTEDAKQGTLTDQEIIGNCFIFLLAGHETTYVHLLE
jgi:cytochrome P450